MNLVLPLRMFFSAVLLTFVGSSAASAHFVWIETAAQGDQLLVRSGFGEPEGWDPDLADRMRSAEFWTRSDAGLASLAVPFDAKESEYRATISRVGTASGSRADAPRAILARSDFGVIALGGKAPTWLRYTAKSLVGPPATWRDTTATPGQRIELLATFEEVKAANDTPQQQVRLTVLHLGKPLANAKLKATPPQGAKPDLVTDDKGVAVWPLAGPGLYACYVGTTTDESGEKDGKPYKSLKDYTTLTFTIAGK